MKNKARIIKYLLIGATISFAMIISRRCGEAGDVDVAEIEGEVVDTNLVYYWRAYDLPQLAVSGEQGVAGALLTMVNGELTLGGGANFPDTPAAEGGTKKIYNSIYTLRDSVWVMSDTLQWPLAYAATAYTPEGLAVLGGNDGANTLALSFMWQNDGRFTALPILPTPTQDAAAAYGDGYVYIVGGMTPDGPTNAVYRLSMGELLEWQQLPPLPPAPRVQCSAAWLEGRLYVAGGYNPSDGTVNSTLFSWTPGDSAWTFVDSLHKPDDIRATTLVGGAMLADAPTRSLIFIGGVDATIFQDAISRPQQLEAARHSGNNREIERLRREADEYLLHEPEWYNFQCQIMSYRLRYNDYHIILNNNSLARAGAAVLKCDSVIYVVNGELKPGIRSNTAVRIVRRH